MAVALAHIADLLNGTLASASSAARRSGSGSLIVVATSTVRTSEAPCADTRGGG